VSLADAKLGLTLHVVECTRNLLGESHPDLIPRLLREGVPASVLATVPYMSKAAIAAAVKSESEAARDRAREAEVQKVLGRVLAEVERREAKPRRCIGGMWCDCAKCERRALVDMYMFFLFCMDSTS
jgi:hypothetical protein